MNVIRPAIFSGLKNISAVFTESNRALGSEDHFIPGLNLGLNTQAEESEIKENYQLLFNRLGITKNLLALARQVHGSRLEIVKRPGIYKKTDGLITKTGGISLGIQVADCAAVLIADDNNALIGAFHAGWRGVAAGIVSKGVKKMESVGGEVKHFKVYISPCISKEMFEVGEEVAVQFPEAFVDRSHYSKPHLDLKGYLTHQLIECGMKASQIEISAECTIRNKQFFSYRRERDKAGRMLGLITLNIH